MQKLNFNSPNFKFVFKNNFVKIIYLIIFSRFFSLDLVRVCWVSVEYLLKKENIEVNLLDIKLHDCSKNETKYPCRIAITNFFAY